MGTFPPTILQPLQHATRQQVFTALFALLQTLPAPPGYSSWGSFSQTIPEVDQVPAANQPSLILVRGPENYSYKAVGTTKLHWRAFILIYFQTTNLKTRSTYPDQFTDPVLDSIEQLFTPPLSNKYFTLGGVVQNCIIDGMVVADPGIVTSTAEIFVPLSLYL
jgi:hypothetical protein